MAEFKTINQFANIMDSLGLSLTDKLLIWDTESGSTKSIGLGDLFTLISAVQTVNGKSGPDVNLILDDIGEGSQYKRLTSGERNKIALIKTDQGEAFYLAGDGHYRQLPDAGTFVFPTVNNIADRDELEVNQDGFTVIVWDASGDPEVESGLAAYAWKADPGEWRRLFGGSVEGGGGDPVPLSAPTLNVVSGNGQADVEITDIDDNATGAELYRATSPDFSDEVLVPLNFSSVAINLTDSPLMNGTRYYYRVKVTGGPGFIDSSFVAKSVVPVDPNQLDPPFLFLLGGNESVDVYVRGAEIRANEIVLMRATQPDYSDEVSVPANLVGESANLTDDNDGAGLNNGTTYYYRTRVERDGFFSPSFWVNGQAIPTALPRLAAPTLRLSSTGSTVNFEIDNIDEDAEEIILTRSIEADFSDEVQVPVLFQQGSVSASDNNVIPGLSYYYRVKVAADGFADSVAAFGNITVEEKGATFELLANSINSYAPNSGLVEYRPKNFDPGNKYPVVISYHGFGEPGDGSIFQLQFVLTNSIGRWIYKTKADIDVILQNFIVVIPQNIASNWGGVSHYEVLHAVRKRSYVNHQMVFLTGHSGGSSACLRLITTESSAPFITGAIPIAGVPITGGQADVSNIEVGKNIPLWSFHNVLDTAPNTIQTIRTWIEARLAAGGTNETWLTAYDADGHDAWNRTWNYDGMQEDFILQEDYEREFDVPIIDWLKQFAHMVPPKVISAVSDGTTAIDVAWEDENDTPDEDGFTLEYREIEGIWQPVQKAQGETTHKITGLTAATSYEFRVLAKGGSANVRDSVYSLLPFFGSTDADSSPTQIIQIHLDRFNNDEGDPGAYWNGVGIHAAIASADQEVRQDLFDIDQDPTGVNMVVVNPAWGGNSATPTVAVDFPINVALHRAFHNAFMENGAEFYVGGLVGSSYRVRTYSYQNEDEFNSYGVHQSLVEWRVQGVSQKINASLNKGHMLVFNNVVPDGNGRIYVGFGKAAGSAAFGVPGQAVIIERIS